MKINKIVFYMLAISCSIFIVLSCSKDDNLDQTEQEVETRSNSCQDVLNFKTTEHSYVSFDVPDEQLNDGERSLKSIKTSYFNYSICKKSSGKLKIEMESTPKIQAEDYKRPLGVQDQVAWKLINDEGNVSIFNGKGELIKSSTNSPINLQEYNVDALFNSDIIPEEDYNLILDQMKRKFEHEVVSDDILLFVSEINGEIVKTYIDHTLQREVAKEYFREGVIVSRRAYLYRTEGTKVSLTREVFETRKKSVDSDLIMNIIQLKEYSIN
jgi:hypothetical protein